MTGVIMDGAGPGLLLLLLHQGGRCVMRATHVNYTGLMKGRREDQHSALGPRGPLPGEGQGGGWSWQPGPVRGRRQGPCMPVWRWAGESSVTAQLGHHINLLRLSTHSQSYGIIELI